jgi:response regulator RpfG family c-di-GMP phosphodiesterase
MGTLPDMKPTILIVDDSPGTITRLGAVDYIAKPLSPPIVMARIRAIQDVAIAAMGSPAETRDKGTGHHIRRTQCYMGALGEKSKDQPRYRAHFSGETIELFKKSATRSLATMYGGQGGTEA